MSAMGPKKHPQMPVLKLDKSSFNLYSKILLPCKRDTIAKDTSLRRRDPLRIIYRKQSIENKTQLLFIVIVMM